MSITVGNPYRFTFTSVGDTETYSTHTASKFDKLSGIYILRGILDFDGVLRDNARLVDRLYKYVSLPNLAQADFDADYHKLKNASFYKIEATSDITEITAPVESDPTFLAETVVIPKGTIIYVPSYLSVGYPNPDVKEYSKLMMTVDLGAFANPDLLVTLSDTVGQILEGYHGVSRTSIQTMIYDSIWLTGEEYASIESARALTQDDQNSSTIGPEHKFTQVNHYTVAKQRFDEITRLNARIATLEAIIEATQP